MQNAAWVINLKHGLSLFRWGSSTQGVGGGGVGTGCSSRLRNQRRDHACSSFGS